MTLKSFADEADVCLVANVCLVTKSVLHLLCVLCRQTSGEGMEELHG